MKPQYNEHLANIVATAREHGVAIIHVFATSEEKAGFSYTVGLEQNYNHPEILIACPVSDGVSHCLLNDVHKLIKDAPAGTDAIPLNTRDDRFLRDMDVVFKQVSDHHADLVASEYTTAANAICMGECGRPARVIQMVLPDSANKMPWDAGYNHAQMAGQVLLFPALS